MSRFELAKRVGVTERQIARYEDGAQPTLPVAQKIAAALGLSLDELAGQTA